MDAEKLLNMLGLLVVTATFALGFWQYLIGQKWKRNEWIAQEVKAFLDDEQIRNALYMLDWSARKIKIHPEKSDINQFITIRNEDIIKALELHGKRRVNFKNSVEKEPIFNDEEVIIRDCFDRLLGGLERFNNYVKTGLVRYEEIAPYLSYWCFHIWSVTTNELEDLINKEKYEKLLEYILEYDYFGAFTLIENLQHFHRRNEAEFFRERLERKASSSQGMR